MKTYIETWVYEPTVTLGEDGLIIADWPNTEPDKCLMSRELFMQWVADQNDFVRQAQVRGR